MRFDMTGVEPADGTKKEYPPLPQGQWFQVEIVKAEIVRKEGKKPYVRTWFKVVDGEYIKRMLFRNFILTQAALGFMKPFLTAIGYPDTGEIDIDPENEEDGWMGAQLMVMVAHETYQGKVKEVPAFYQSLEQANRTHIDSEDEPTFP